MQPVRVTLVPLVVTFAALFVILPRTGGDATIAMVGTSGSFAFAPDELEVDRGARVRVVNRSDATHTITTIAEGFNLVVQPGQSSFLELDEDRAFDYFCRYHGSTDQMTGTLTVGDPPVVPSEPPSPTPS